jgi:hypothetical protein
LGGVGGDFPVVEGGGDFPVVEAVEAALEAVEVVSAVAKGGKGMWQRLEANPTSACWSFSSAFFNRSLRPAIVSLSFPPWNALPASGSLDGRSEGSALESSPPP